VLRGVDVQVAPGEIVALVGGSGAGKTTLLQILGTLDTPTTGLVQFEGNNLFTLTDKALSAFRNKHLGFVFQFHHLLAEFTALENAAMPAFIQGGSRKAALARAEEVLSSVGLAHRLHHKPSGLSGGEQQRVAVARALVNQPRLILADEPTGNLDTANGRALFDLFLKLALSQGIAFLIATHNEQFARLAHSTLHIQDGLLVTEAA